MTHFKTLFFIALTMVVGLSATAKEKKSFMWKVESEKTKMYIVGSIHLANISLYPLPAVMEQAFDTADILAVEVNINTVNPLALTAKMFYSDGSTLRSALPDTIYNILLERFKKVKMPELYFSKMKPWAAVMTLAQLEMKGKGLDPEFGIDKYYLDKAGKDKPIHELESFDMQLSLFDEFDKHSDIYVKYSMEDLDESLKLVESIISAWKAGDAELLDRLITDSYKDYPQMKELMTKLNDERNILMTNKIENWLKGDKVYFVIAGAAHIVGDKGIISLLNKSGKYKITQM